ncbi:MAG: PaaI family thioesterase [Porticoccaceae bacterium]|nr:PaaI family thioesterase [Porticoccaceae bacterium]
MNLKLAIFKPMLKLAMERTGHGAALGFELTRVGRGEVEMSFPYKDEVVGNPVTGVVHGGVIVSLLDTCCGCAAISVLKRPSVTPTMDLRLDYMHPAEPGQPIYVSAKVYRDTSNVIFCRGSAWQDDPENPIAHCVATFMRVDTPSISLGNVIRRRFKRLIHGDKAYEREADK